MIDMYDSTEVQYIVHVTFESTFVPSYLRTQHNKRRYESILIFDTFESMTNKGNIQYSSPTRTVHVYTYVDKQLRFRYLNIFQLAEKTASQGWTPALAPRRGTAPRSWRARGDKIEGREVVRIQYEVRKYGSTFVLPYFSDYYYLYPAGLWYCTTINVLSYFRTSVWYVVYSQQILTRLYGSTVDVHSHALSLLHGPRVI